MAASASSIPTAEPAPSPADPGTAAAAAAEAGAPGSSPGKPGAGTGGQGKDLFAPVAASYARYRPTYPRALFEFVARHAGEPRGLAWDVGTGSGQAALQLAEHFSRVLGTDLSAGQLAHAAPHPRVSYAVTGATPSEQELDALLGPPGSVDAVTVAQAYHWFNFHWFHHAVQRALRPGGVVAVWAYGLPSVSPEFDAAMWEWYQSTWPYWEPQRKFIDKGYTDIPFPFSPVPGVSAETGEAGTGPLRLFASELRWSLEDFLGYLSSWSPMPTARKQGVDLLNGAARGRLHAAWGEPGSVRLVRFPIHLRIGTVGGGHAPE